MLRYYVQNSSVLPPEYYKSNNLFIRLWPIAVPAEGGLDNDGYTQWLKVFVFPPAADTTAARTG